MKKIKIYPQIIDEYQSSEIAEQENLKEDWMGAKYWFENVVESDDEFELDDMPKYNRFICHMDYINSDLYYDYGAGYYFAVLNELKTENMKRNAIRLTESDLHRVIKECVKKVLSEGEGRLQSSKLEQIIKQHGGIKRYEDRTHEYSILPHLTDDDFICALPDPYFFKEKMPNEYREYRTLENYVKQTYFNGSQPSEMHILPLKDGYNLWFKPSFRGYDMSNPIFDKHNKRTDYNNRSDYSIFNSEKRKNYNWNNKEAEDYFKNKRLYKALRWKQPDFDIKMDNARSEHEQNMGNMKK